MKVTLRKLMSNQDAMKKGKEEEEIWEGTRKKDQGWMMRAILYKNSETLRYNSKLMVHGKKDKSFILLLCETDGKRKNQ